MTPYLANGARLKWLISHLIISKSIRFYVKKYFPPLEDQFLKLFRSNIIQRHSMRLFGSNIIQCQSKFDTAGTLSGVSLLIIQLRNSVSTLHILCQFEAQVIPWMKWLLNNSWSLMKTNFVNFDDLIQWKDPTSDDWIRPQARAWPWYSLCHCNCQYYCLTICWQFLLTNTEYWICWYFCWQILNQKQIQITWYAPCHCRCQYYRTKSTRLPVFLVQDEWT